MKATTFRTNFEVRIRPMVVGLPVGLVCNKCPAIELNAGAVSPPPLHCAALMHPGAAPFPQLASRHKVPHTDPPWAPQPLNSSPCCTHVHHACALCLCLHQRQDANLSDVLMDRATMVEANLKNAVMQVRACARAPPWRAVRSSGMWVRRSPCSASQGRGRTPLLAVRCRAGGGGRANPELLRAQVGNGP